MHGPVAPFFLPLSLSHTHTLSLIHALTLSRSHSLARAPMPTSIYQWPPAAERATEKQRERKRERESEGGRGRKREGGRERERVRGGEREKESESENGRERKSERARGRENGRGSEKEREISAVYLLVLMNAARCTLNASLCRSLIKNRRVFSEHPEPKTSSSWIVLSRFAQNSFARRAGTGNSQNERLTHCFGGWQDPDKFAHEIVATPLTNLNPEP